MYACLPSRCLEPPRRRLQLVPGLPVTAVLLTVLISGPSLGFSLTDPNRVPINILAEPDNFVSWSKGGIFDPISYTFSTAFAAAFPDARQREQVHLAFDEWEEASFDMTRRAANAKYEWTRKYNGAPAFWDLRSVMTHELGHVLGSQHPDASWFNDTDPGPAYVPYHLNYRPDGMGGYEAAAPIGGEIMNEGQSANDLPNNKPPKGLDYGEYWRKVSKDELNFLDYVYGHQLHFQYVGVGNANADITIDLFDNPEQCGGNLGLGGADDIDPRAPGQGWDIVRASVDVRTCCTDVPGSPKIGFVAKPRYWEITNNTGDNAISFLLTTIGTDNTNPTDEYSVGSRRFTDYTNFYSADPTTSLETILHQWTKPTGGPIPDGSSVQVALQQDTWDWYVQNPELLKEDLTSAPVALVNVTPFFFPQFQGEGGGAPVAEEPDLEGLHLSDIAEPEMFAAKSLRIANDNIARVEIQQVLVAPVEGLHKRPRDLGPNLLAELQASDLVETIIGPGGTAPLSLGANADFYIVMDGTVDDLPREIVDSGNYLFFSRPSGPTRSCSSTSSARMRGRRLATSLCLTAASSCRSRPAPGFRRLRRSARLVGRGGDGGDRVGTAMYVIKPPF